MKGNQSFDSFEVLCIEITNQCNFNCIHCGNASYGNRNIGFEDIKRILEDFNLHNGKKLILSGGEPFLHPKFKEILDITKSHNYSLKISTNGFFLKNFNFDYVFDYDVGFRVSLDGTKGVHNKIRGNPEAYDSLILSMKKISSHKKQLVIRTTVMKENKNSIVEMIYELDRLSKEENLNIYSLNIWPMRKIGKSSSSQVLSSEEYKLFLENLNFSTKNLKPKFRIIVGPTFGYEENFRGGPLQFNEIYKCDILNTSLHISSNGDILPCSFIYYPLGNVNEIVPSRVFNNDKSKTFRKIFLERKNHDCGDCGYYNSCKAGCIAEKFNVLFSKNKFPIKDVYCFRK